MQNSFAAEVGGSAEVEGSTEVYQLVFVSLVEVIVLQLPHYI